VPRQANAAVLEAVDISKSFGRVQALHDARITCEAGKVTALIGDNGAGKSTLVKVLSGATAPDGGVIRIGGVARAIRSPGEAHRAGIQTVYQDLALAPDLSPPGNLFLGQELCRKGFLGRLGVLDKREMRRRTREAFQSLGVRTDADSESMRHLSGGEQQGVAVARAVLWASSIVILDEPTAALGVVQTKNVLNLIRRVADQGLAVLLISHNLPDVLQVADRIEVLYLGRSVATFNRDDANTENLVGAMTGAFKDHTRPVSH
jgi:simple sugar transport system ATP-binding protein